MKAIRSFGQKVLLRLKTAPFDRLAIPLLFVALLLKNVLFQSYVSGGSPFVPGVLQGLLAGLKGLLTSVAVIVLTMAPLWLFQTKKGRLIYAFVISGLCTVLLLIDSAYFRSSPEMASLALLAIVKDATGQGHLSVKSFYEILSPYDLLYLLDYLILIALAIFRKYALRGKTAPEAPAAERKKPKNAFAAFCTGTRAGRFLCTALPCVLILSALPLLQLFGAAKGLYQTMYRPAYRKDIAMYFTSFGYHVSDAFTVVGELMQENRPVQSGELPSGTSLPEDDPVAEQILAFYRYNREDLPANEWTGAFEGKNVLILQVESLERFLIGQTYMGKEITPNLNRLVAEGSGIVFSQIHDQVKSGNSSDCDLMINTSILPTGKIFFKNYSDKYLPSLPALLREHGYETYYFNGSGHSSVWPYNGVYSNAFGYNTDESSPDCNFFLLEPEDDSELIYRYLSDKVNLTRVGNFLLERESDAPFFSHVVLCSSHMPFTYIYNELPADEILFRPVEKDLRSSKTLAYFNCVHFVDEAIGEFLQSARESGALDNTVVLIYGDHTGLHKYYPQEIAELAEKYDDLAFAQQEEQASIFFMIYDPSGKTPGVVCDRYGGQSDVLPTLCELLGLERSEWSFAMGRSLVNTQRNYTLLPSGEILGELSKTDPAYDVVYRMYNTSELIVKYDFFKRPEAEKEEASGKEE